MKKKASELIFISQIKRDGSGTSPVPESMVKFLCENKFCGEDEYEVIPLSLTMETFIAHGFNSFVVKIKPK